MLDDKGEKCMKIVFLGTSDSQGVPRLHCQCPVCKDNREKNIRNRPSLLLISDTDERLIIDISPEFKHQYFDYSLFNDITPDAVITHAHNDHIGGFVDYADMNYWNKKCANVISTQEVIDEIRMRYPFVEKRKCINFISTESWLFSNLKINLHRINHGFNGYSNGIIFETQNKKWGYFSDCFNLTSEQLDLLLGLDLLIIGTCYWKENAPSYRRSLYDVQEAIEIKQKYNIKQMILTHLSHEIDYYHHQMLPENSIELAYDGMLIEI